MNNKEIPNIDMSIFNEEHISNIQTKLNNLSNTYSQKLSQIELIKQQNEQILKQFNVTNIQELINLRDTIYNELQTLIPQAEELCTNLESEIKQIDEILIQS